MNPFKSIIALAFIVALILPLPTMADEHEDEDGRTIHRRTKAEVRNFLKEHFPEPLEHLHHAEEEGDEEAAEEFWHEASEFVGEFYVTHEEVGGEAAEAYLIMRRTEYIADRLTDKFHEVEDDKVQHEIKEELREILGKHLKHRIMLEKLELERAHRELEEAAHELEEVTSHFEEIIEEEVEERIHGEREHREHDDHDEDREGHDEEHGEDDDDEDHEHGEDDADREHRDDDRDEGEEEEDDDDREEEDDDDR